MEDEKYVSLENIGSGAAVEKFNFCFQEALADCIDLNKRQKDKRKIILELGLNPNLERTAINMSIQCNVVLAKNEPFDSYGFIGRDKGKPVAYEHHPDQQTLFDENNVKKMK